MIRINGTIAIDESDVSERFIRVMGPGGQNSRSDQTAVQLRYDVSGSSLPEAMKLRLSGLAGRHLTPKGVLVVESRAYRSQLANRQAAHERLAALLRRAAREPVARRATRPRRADRETRVIEKRLHGSVKQLRSQPQEE